MSKAAESNPIVISGMAGMFPGAPDVDAFWQRIRGAEVAPLVDLGPRWGVDPERYLAAQPGVPDRTYVDQAHCLAEDAGCDLSALADRQARIGQAVLRQLLASLSNPPPENTGLVLATEWTGSGWFEQAARDGLTGLPDIDLLPPPAVAYAPEQQLDAIAGGLLSAAAPRLAIDTACASSLYGIDLARRLLLSGRADAVVVMGLTAWLPLFLLTSFSQLMALSPERRLLPYAANASGIMLGEAGAAVLVEPLAKALAAGRPVLAVLRRQGLSADGADRSVFAPGRDGQRLMYQRSYQDLPADLDYLEGHGTATKLGDETELAIMREFFADLPPAALPIGSVKGLIGHTLAAAGLCSTIKALLMLRARELPPHNAVQPNEVIAGSALTLLTDATPWPAPSHRPRRVGVSCFGFGGANAHLVLDEYRAQDWPQPSFTPLPWGKLALVDLESTESTAGEQLPAEFTLEAQGLRMGPNFLKRLDPYQLLLTDLAHRIVDRNPELAGAENAGVVMGSNLGGALSLKLMRRGLWLTRHHPGTRGATARADRYGPKHSLESIASCLPNMCSGYPAFHFNLRGFHQTLSGGAGLFWESLALAPRWLDDACDRLLLGAGRINKWSGESGGESAAFFLLQPAERSTRPPRAILHAMFPAALAPDLASACALAGLSAGEFDWQGVSELESNRQHEASGTDILLRALAEAKRWAAIEVRRDGRLLFTVLLENFAQTPSQRPVLQLPVTVLLRETPAAVVLQSAVMAPPEKQVLTPVAIEAPRGDAIGTMSPQVARQWLSSTSSGLHSFFAAQRGALQLLGTAAAVVARPGSVIANPCRNGDGSLQAQLCVDESQPYFFDHALDHVPGILMLEGLLQLAAWGGQPGAWVQHIKLSFRRFCEKAQPVLIRLQAEGANGWAGTVEQAGDTACRCQLVLATALPAATVIAATSERGRSAAELVHKQQAENILVSPLFDLADGVKACETHAPPSGHVLAAGADGRYGTLYLLETTRQFVMLIAHTVWNVPLGLPMNLLSIQLDLERPVRHDESITISHRPMPLAAHEESAIVVVDCKLASAGVAIGRATIVAQALTRAGYAKQRQATAIKAATEADTIKAATTGERP